MTRSELPNNSLLYIIIVVVGLICGLGWGSLLLPILVYHLLLGIAVAALWTYNKLIS